MVSNSKRCFVQYGFHRLSLLPLLTNTLPGPSASDVTTLWRYTKLFIIIIIIINIPGSKDPRG